MFEKTQEIPTVSKSSDFLSSNPVKTTCDTISESHCGLPNPLVVLLEIRLPNKFQTFHENVLLVRIAVFSKSYFQAPVL